MAKTKLKDLLSEVFEDVQKVDKYKVSEGVRNFGIVGKSLYGNSNIMEVAEQLANIAEQAHHHILGENDDWFDKISVNKNMKFLKGSVMEFQKTAKEAHMLNQRLTGLYEDIGHVLNRYYDIDEDKGDMDNDGLSEPDDEEYLDNKDKAIKHAMKKETKSAPGELDNNDDEKIKEPHGSQYDHSVKETKAAPGELDNNDDEEIKKPHGSQYKEQREPKRFGTRVVGIPALGDMIRNK